jgi:oligopeptide transport system substrate-binding protein
MKTGREGKGSVRHFSSCFHSFLFFRFKKEDLNRGRSALRFCGMKKSGSPRVGRGWIVAGFAVGALTLFLAFFYFFGGWSLGAPADLTLCNGAELQTLDPAIITDEPGLRVAQALFEGLSTRNAKGEVIPGMAQNWTLSPDGRVYTFTLRPGVKWSNGEPVTSYDFLNSWERALNPATGSQYSYQLYYLVNGEAYGTGKLTDFSQVGVKAPDDHTLVATLIHPTAYFLELTTLPTLYAVPLKSIQKFGRDWTKPGKLVSNGPYLLREWRLNDYILLEANPAYWRPVPIRRIKVLPTDSPTACFNLFYSHKTDLIIDKNSIPAELVQSIRAKPYFHSNPFGATTFIRFNVKRKPFDDVRVRKALALALDKQDIVDKITRAGEPVANTLVPPGSAGYVPPQGLVRNLDEARRLLAEAGYPDGRGFPEVTLLYPSRGTVWIQMATEMQALWRRDLGINSITLRGQEWRVYLNTEQLIDFDLSLTDWIGDYNDPQTFLDMFVTGGGNNETNWSNPRYDQMLQATGTAPNPTQRMQTFHDMEKILVEDEVPIVPIYFWVGLSLYDPDKLGGYEPNFVDEHVWGNFYIPGKKR